LSSPFTSIASPDSTFYKRKEREREREIYGGHTTSLLLPIREEDIRQSSMQHR